MGNNISYISFSMYADEWPADRFTEESGIIPTEVIYGGKENPRIKNQRYVETVWTIETVAVPDQFTENEEVSLFEQLFTQLRPKIELIYQYRVQYDLQCLFFFLYKFYEAQTPGLHFSEEIIAFMAKIGAIVDVYIDNEANWEDEENLIVYQ